MNSLQIKEVDNEVLADADAYLREHKILELFEVRNTYEPSVPLQSLRFAIYGLYNATHQLSVAKSGIKVTDALTLNLNELPDCVRLMADCLIAI